MNEILNREEFKKANNDHKFLSDRLKWFRLILSENPDLQTEYEICKSEYKKVTDKLINHERALSKKDLLN